MKKSLRWRVLARDCFTCAYCGRTAPEVELEVDHIIPRSRGGPNTEANLVTACWTCNRGKSAWASREPLDIMARVASLAGEVDRYYGEAMDLAAKSERLHRRVALLVNEVAHLSDGVEGDVWDWLENEIPA